MSDKAKWTPGPCESLARLALQSVQYQQDGEFREAVDAVLGQSMYDAAPLMAEALRDARRYIHVDCPISDHGDEHCADVCLKARAALRAAGVASS